MKKGRNTVRREERWNSWVPDYLRSRYAGGKTHGRYVNAWAHLESFLLEKHIGVPAAWKVEHNAQYVDWKEDQGYAREAAIWDLGALAMIMNEAVRREFLEKHKVSKSRIRRGVVAEKPALTDEQIAILRENLKDREDLATAFEIALHTGCRLSETVIPFDRINLERGTITFLPKGGKERMFSAPMIFPAFKQWMMALIKKRKAQGHKTTCDLTGAASRDFGRLCRKLKLKGPGGETVSFHCLRVTFVTRAFEAGLSGEIVRKLVNHSDIIVNRLYQRFSIEGLTALGAKLNLPVVPAPPDPLDISSATPMPPRTEASHPPGEDHRPASG